MTVLSFILFLAVAAACAWIAAAIVPTKIPGGFFAAAVSGIVGAWLGSSLFGHLGPNLIGVPIFPAILGSAILVFALAFLSRTLPTQV